MSTLCPSDKILNPRTNRCVKKTGRTGKKLIPVKDKQCDENKIINPRTKRCVKRLSRIGRKLSPVDYIREKAKNCDENKIINPRTRRCVKKDGKVGRRITRENYTPKPLEEDSEDELEDVLDDQEVDLSDLIDDQEQPVLQEITDDEEQPVLQEITDEDEELEEMEKDEKNDFLSRSQEFYYYSMKYLNEKYDECFLKPLSVTKTQNGSKEPVDIDNDYQLLWEDKPSKETVINAAENDNVKLYGNSYSFYVDDKNRDNKKVIDGLLYVNKKLTHRIMECVKGKSRFIILTLNISNIDEQDNKRIDISHSNILIYDKKNNTLERYEPQGPGYSFLQKKSSKLIDVDLLEYFMDIGLLKSKDDYYSPINFCPQWDKWQEGRVGHQMLQNLESKEFVQSCATWCMWYVDDRLQKPNISRDRIIQESIEEMQKSSRGFTNFVKKYYRIIQEYRDKN